MDRKKKLLPWARFICMGLIASIMVIMIELLARSGVKNVCFWLMDHPAYFALNVALTLMLMTAMVVLMGRILYGVAVGSIMLIVFGVINKVKISVLQEPFFAWDLLYIKQMGALGTSFLSKEMIIVLSSLSVLLICVFFCFFIKNMRRSTLQTRMIALIAATALLGSFCFETTNPIRLLQVENVVWDQAENYNTNGFILAFSMNISPILITQPDEYDLTLIQRLVEHNEKLGDEVGFNDQRISLIFFMSESFSDLADSLFGSSDNPLENLKHLVSQYPSFRLISPTYAGNTSLVEFEALTGLSNAFLPSGAIPFDHYLRRPTPSIAWILKEHGYHTIAIHPFYDWFWNRKIVYPNLGFQKFISINQFDESAKLGFYISDEALVDKIMEVINSTQGPYFIHAVSMENHGPYNLARYDDAELQVATSLSKDLRFELASYITGLRDADKQLARLLQYLTDRNEPVICLFFGDHQPDFGIALYNEIGKMRDGIEMDYQMSVVPGLLWSNRKDLLDAKDIPEQMSPIYFPAIILHQMKIPLPGYMFYLRQGLSNYPVVHRNFVADPNGNLIQFNECRHDPYLRGLEVLNYDVLFGSSYSWKL